MSVPYKLTATGLARLLWLDVDRRVVRGRKRAKHYLMNRGYHATADVLDDVLESIATHPKRAEIESEFCRLVIEGDDDESADEDPA